MSMESIVILSSLASLGIAILIGTVFILIIDKKLAKRRAAKYEKRMERERQLKAFRDDLWAKLNEIFGVVDPSVDLPLLCKKTYEELDPGVEYELVSNWKDPQQPFRDQNYIAVLRYSWNKHKYYFPSWLSTDEMEAANTPKAATALLEKEETPIPRKAFDDMETKFAWFTARYEAVCDDFSLRKKPGSEQSFPILFFVGKQIYEFIPPAKETDAEMLCLKLLYLYSAAEFTKEEFALKLLEIPDLKRRVRNVTRFFTNCPLLPPVLPPQIMQENMTLKQRIFANAALVGQLKDFFVNCVKRETARLEALDPADKSTRRKK